MPVYDYECLGCGECFEAVVMPSQSNMQPPTNCPTCKSEIIERRMGCPSIRMGGRRALRSVPDPHPPLQELRGKNQPGCEGGFADLPEFNPNKSTQTKDGVEWSEKKKQIIDMGKK
jgi:putative FmdB family regulatory protein